MEAIITHELCHVRRRDNLAAAVHMFVEAIFWFHPLVWWIGARLVDERERACDEEVLRLGNETQAYAQGILNVCEFYLESPLVCVAGVTGSNLKKRIEAIMIHRVVHELDLRRKVLLAVMGVLALIGPVVIGLMNPAPTQAQAVPLLYRLSNLLQSNRIDQWRIHRNTTSINKDYRRQRGDYQPVAEGACQVCVRS